MKANLYFFYLPFNLSAKQKILFNVITLSLKILFIFLGLGLFLTNFSYFKLIGFWLFVIYFFHFLFFLNTSSKNILFEKVNNLADCLNYKTKNIILKSSINTELFKDISKFDIFLIYILLDDYDIKTILAKYFNLDIKYIKDQIKDIIKNIEIVNYIDIKKTFSKTLNKNIESLIYIAYEIIKKFDLSFINNIILFSALLKKKDPIIDTLFSKYDINFNNFLAASFFYRINFWGFLFKKNLNSAFVFKNRHWFNKKIIFDEPYLLKKFGLNLTLLAKLEKFKYFLNREEEINKLIKVINEENQVKIILKGNKGVGKKSLIYYLTYTLSQKEELSDLYLIELDLIKLYFNDKENYEENVIRLLNEAISYNKIVLFLPDFEKIIFDKKYNKILTNIYNYVKFGKLNVIITINDDYYLNKINLVDFKDFIIIEIQPPSLDDSFFILLLESINLIYKEKILIYPKSLELIVNLSSNFIKDKFLPSSAIWLLYESIKFAKNYGLNSLTPEIIGDTFSKLTSIDISSPNLFDRYILENLEDIIHQKYVNQNYALKELAYVLKKFRLDKLSTRKPISLFFIGPNGCGKTYLTQILANIYFGSQEKMLILDGNNFQNDFDIVKLIGDKENNITGILTDYVIKNPYIFILLKNFEKFNKNIIDLFLPIFYNGYIKDGENKEVDFSKSIIICESSLFSDLIKINLKNNKKIYEIKNLIISKLLKIYPYEFLSLFSGIIIFEPLNYENILEILNLNLKNINLEFNKKYHLYFELSEELKNFIIKKANYKKLGAQKLNYIIDKLVISKLNKFVESFQENNKINNIFIDIKNNKLFLEIVR